MGPNRVFGIGMLRSFVLKVSLFVVTVALCMSLLTANVKGVDWTSPTTNTLYSVDMVTSSDGWAVGPSGTIIHWNGIDWVNFTGPIPPADFHDVFMVNSTDGWIVGLQAFDTIYREGIIIHWDGTTWTPGMVSGPPPTDSLNSVFIVNASDGWAVGNAGTVIHWDGTVWTSVPSPTSANLYSVDMIDSSYGWAVGAQGTIIQWTGSEWVPEFPSAWILPLIILLSLITVALSKRRDFTKPKT